MKKQLITLAALAGGFIIGASALVALADSTWTSAPPCTSGNMPCNNVPAPINVGNGTAILQSEGKILTSIQEKTDSMAIDGNLGVLGTLAVNYLNVASGTVSTYGSVLTNDGAGNASWAPSSGGGGGPLTVQTFTFPPNNSYSYDLGHWSVCSITKDQTTGGTSVTLTDTNGDWSVTGSNPNAVSTGAVCFNYPGGVNLSTWTIPQINVSNVSCKITPSNPVDGHKVTYTLTGSVTGGSGSSYQYTANNVPTQGFELFAIYPIKNPNPSGAYTSGVTFSGYYYSGAGATPPTSANIFITDSNSNNSNSIPCTY